MFELSLFSTIFEEIQEELQYLVVNCYQMSIGFILCHQYINTQSLLDWTISLSFMDMIFRRIIQYGLELIIPEQLAFLHQNQRLSEFLSLACLSYFFHQSLLILMMSKVLYFCYYIFCQLFSHQPIQLLVIAYYMHNIWLLLPLFAKIGLTLLFWMDSLLSSQILKKVVSSSLLLALLSELGVRKQDIMSLSRTHANTQDLSYQYQEMMQQQRTKVQAAFATFNCADQLLEFKQYLAQRYHEAPALYFTNDGTAHVLPIDSRHLSYFLLGKDTYQTNEILKAYYQHPVHTVWRILQPENAWQDNSNHYHQIQHLYARRDYLHWFVYFWYTAHAQSNADHFVKVFASLCRAGNKEHQFQGEILVVESDNLSADRPGNEEAIHAFIIQYLDKSAEINILTATKLKRHLHEFLKHHWENKLKTLTRFEFNQFSRIWRTIMDRDGLWFMFSDNYRQLELNIALKMSFKETIQVRYGDVLDASPEFCEIIDDYFLSRYQHDIEHHALPFNQAISNVSRTM